MSNKEPDTKRPRLITLPTFEEDRGRLTVAEAGEAVPFDIERIYYLYDVPQDVSRGHHAHRDLEQVMVAVSGALEVHLEGAFGSEDFRLDSPEKGLYVPRMTWRELTAFSDDATCLIIASHPYDPDDYIHELETFRAELDETPSG